MTLISFPGWPQIYLKWQSLTLNVGTVFSRVWIRRERNYLVAKHRPRLLIDWHRRPNLSALTNLMPDTGWFSAKICCYDYCEFRWLSDRVVLRKLRSTSLLLDIKIPKNLERTWNTGILMRFMQCECARKTLTEERKVMYFHLEKT